MPLTSLAPTDLALRGDFPILRRQVHNKPLIYLDNAATSQKPQAVLDAINAYYCHSNANVHRGVHTLSNEATDGYEAARSKIATFINAASPNEIVYTRNASEAINIVAYTWAMSTLKPGDEILLSRMEHHSNLVPWQFVAQRTGAVLQFVDITPNGSLDLEQFQAILSERTKLVAMVHVSNMLGTINPMKDIIRLAHAQGSRVLVDACQSVPHMAVDVQSLDCDWLVFSGHKMCGPTGIGILYGKLDLLEAMPPFMGGGEMIADVFWDRATYAALPHKFEAGTPAVAQAIGLGAAVDYLQALGMQRIHAHEEQLTQRLLQGLQAIDGIQIFGPLDPRQRAGLVSFAVEGIHAHDLSTLLDQEGIAIRAGHHCTQPLHRHLGVAATARASVYLYNTLQEVEQFLVSLQETITFFHEAMA